MPINDPVFADRVRETSSTKGTDAFVLDGAMAGYSAFADHLPVGRQCFYTAVNLSKPSEAETGVATMAADGRLERDVTGGALDFSNGTKAISLVLGSDWLAEAEAALSNLPDDQYLSPATGAVSRPIADKLGETVTPQDFGALGDGIADDTVAVQAALDASRTVMLPPGAYRITDTIRTRDGQTLIGSGDASVLKADGIAGPALATYSGSGTASAPNQHISNFVIVGTASCALAAAHCTSSHVGNLWLQSRTHGLSFDGVDGFVFEHLWASRFNGLYANGATLSGVPFKVNKVVLNSVFDHLYSSNFSDYSLVIDSGLTEISTGTGVGFGGNSLRNIAVQGADRYGIKIVNAANCLFENIYTENCLGAVDIRGGTDLMFSASSFQGVRGTATHDVHVDGDTSISGVLFDRCAFHPSKKVIGAVIASISFRQPRVTGNADFISLIERNANTPSSMPLYVEVQGTSHATILMKTDNWSWKQGQMKLTESGGVPVWSGATVTPALTSVVRH